MGDEKASLLIVIERAQTFPGLREGYRETSESWWEVLRDLKKSGLKMPTLVIGAGARGFWAALREVFPLTQQQLCWLNETRNLLDKLPKKEQAAAVQRLRVIRRASSCSAAEKLARQLIADWRKPYPAAAANLAGHLKRLLNFYD